MPNYDQIAEWYDASVRAGSLMHDIVVPALFELAGDVKGKHICDLACGQGALARQLAERGASVVGVDVSEKLLEIARREEQSKLQGIVYVQDDAETLETCADAIFDGIVCNMALMDIADLSATFRAVQRALRAGGWFVFTITHPCFQTATSHWVSEGEELVSRAVRGYFTEGFWRSDYAGGVRGQVGAYHRTLSTYINTLREAGFIVERAEEPQARGMMAERLPGYKEVPVAIAISCRKI